MKFIKINNLKNEIEFKIIGQRQRVEKYDLQVVYIVVRTFNYKTKTSVVELELQNFDF